MMNTMQKPKKMWTGTFSRLGTMLHLFWKNRKYDLWLFWATLGPLYIFFTRFFMRMDDVVYPQLKKVQIQNPVFIMGHPRSGTTFFQKRVHDSGKVSMFTTWEIALPSILQRKIFGPIIQLFKLFELRVLRPARKGHEVRIDGVEEDEGIFLHRLDSEMVTVFCPWLLIDEEYRDLGMRLGWNDKNQNRSSLLFYKETLRRQIFHSGKKQVVAKFNPSILRLENILKVFPDARIVYIVRSPKDTLRSFFSFTHKLIDDNLSDEEQQAFFERKYQWSVQLYKYFEEVKEQIPPERLMVVRFTDLTNHLLNTMDDFFTFIQLAPGDNYWESIRQQANSSHKKKHRNETVESFGISEERIEKDLRFVYDRYLTEEKIAES